MRNGRASVSRAGKYAYTADSFALMSVGARHARARLTARNGRARSTRVSTEKARASRGWEGERERERESAGSYAHAERRRRKRQLQPRALHRCRCLLVPSWFYRFASTTLPLLRHPPSSSLPSSLYMYMCVLFFFLSLLRESEFCRLVHLALFLPRADATRRRDTLHIVILLLAYGDTHARMYRYAHRGARGRAPKRTTGLVTCSLADSQRSYSHRRHLAQLLGSNRNKNGGERWERGGEIWELKFFLYRYN